MPISAGKTRPIIFFHATTERLSNPLPRPARVCPGTPQATRTTQKRAKEVYTKHYDSENMAYYWYNKEIGTYLWKKPSGLGGWDVDPEDRVSCGRASLYSPSQNGQGCLCCTHACVWWCCAELSVRPVVAVFVVYGINQPWFRKGSASFRFVPLNVSPRLSHCVVCDRHCTLNNFGALAFAHNRFI